MSETRRMALPLLAAGQAQKHVTVNEALARLDALVWPQVISAGLSTPPVSPAEGDAHVVAGSPTGAWAGHAAQIAFCINGGWDFASPRAGWRAFDLESGRVLLFDGTQWVSDALSFATGGAATLGRVIEIDHVVEAGTVSTAAGAIPAGAVVLGVSARVTSAITGGATSWSLGVAGSADRYGSSLGVGLNSYAAGVTGSPQAYYGATALTLTAAGGSFSGGSVRLAVHLWELQPPRSV
ncbi:DUF2793 domain-containing protein [Paroceanicella profunda]|uniref:DUF2793 domain-containing protein n=1 Tax=Paroceanicella profunda TaxID=2579971 RepID=A0A5B8G1W8_9RHOB|nr:DUF2793 domain-containing protein [Paroceanicella profunda]QDL93072.1 DUF2793 domain-containing protein [Paroceanicella profunda]